MSKCVVGLDGGGTKTHAVVFNDGSISGEGTAGPCNIAAVLPDQAAGAALTAVDAALRQAGRQRKDVSALCAAVAGYSQADRRAQFTEALTAAFGASTIAVEPDYAAALWGATEGAAGIVVIAGTGSVAFGEDAAGRSCRTGAYGYLVDDSGSGYGVGRAMLAAVLHALDRTGPQTSLSERLRNSYGLESFVEIVSAVYGGSMDRLAIAGSATLVTDAAREDNDPVARSILMHAGGALARLVEPIVRDLFPGVSEAPVPVASVGSLWLAGLPLTDVFDRSLARICPDCVRIAPRLSPAHGAGLRAQRLAR